VDPDVVEVVDLTSPAHSPRSDELKKDTVNAETQVDDGDIDGASDIDPERELVGRVMPAVAAGCVHTYAEVVSLWRPPLPIDVKLFVIPVAGTEVIVDALERIQVEEISAAVVHTSRFVEYVESHIVKGCVRLCYFNRHGDKMMTMNDGAHMFLNIRVAATQAGQSRALFAVCDEIASYAAPRRGELRSILCAEILALFQKKRAKTQDVCI
jgi:hypothetical protein